MGGSWDVGMSSASAGAGLVCCRGRCCSDGDAALGTDRGGLLLVLLLLSLLPLPLLAEDDVVLDEELGPGEGGTAAAAPVAGACCVLLGPVRMGEEDVGAAERHDVPRRGRRGGSMVRG